MKQKMRTTKGGVSHQTSSREEGRSGSQLVKRLLAVRKSSPALSQPKISHHLHIASLLIARALPTYLPHVATRSPLGGPSSASSSSPRRTSIVTQHRQQQLKEIH